MKHGKKKSSRSPRATSVPLAAPVPATVSQAPDAAPSAAPLHILLIEDNTMDIALIGHLLRTTGREIVLTTVDTCDALEAELKRRLDEYRSRRATAPTQKKDG